MRRVATSIYGALQVLGSEWSVTAFSFERINPPLDNKLRLMAAEGQLHVEVLKDWQTSNRTLFTNLLREVAERCQLHPCEFVRDVHVVKSLGQADDDYRHLATPTFVLRRGHLKRRYEKELAQLHAQRKLAAARERGAGLEESGR